MLPATSSMAQLPYRIWILQDKPTAKDVEEGLKAKPKKIKELDIAR